MELYQLRTFVAVAEEGHLTRAAERLHLSQPAVSAQIRALEDELAVPLFSRTPKGMILTAAGEKLKARAMHVLSSASDLQQHARELAGAVAGTIHLAVHIDPHYLQLPTLIAMLQADFPAIRCELRQNMSWETISEIRSERLDAGFIYGMPDPPELQAMHLRDFRLRVVGPMAWRARLEQASWQEIAGMPWIWTPEHCLFSQVAGSCFAQKGLTPMKSVVADQEAVLSSLVSSGVGLSLMIEEEALAAEQGGGVALWSESVGVVPLCFVFLGRRQEDPLLRSIRCCLARIWHSRIDAEDEIPFRGSEH